MKPLRNNKPICTHSAEQTNASLQEMRPLRNNKTRCTHSAEQTNASLQEMRPLRNNKPICTHSAEQTNASLKQDGSKYGDIFHEREQKRHQYLQTNLLSIKYVHYCSQKS